MVFVPRRGESKEGAAPSFVVSIRESPERGRNRNLPLFGVLSLFVHFLFARAKRKWTLTSYHADAGKRAVGGAGPYNVYEAAAESASPVGGSAPQGR